MAIAQEQFNNAQISLFFDPAYVDTGSASSDEAYNMRQVLEGIGHTIKPFTGTDTSAWREATLNANVLVIPSLNNIAPGAQFPLSTGAMFFLKEFVSRGNTLIVVSEIGNEQRNTNLLDALFDTALNELNYNPTFPASSRTSDATGTVYATAGTPLPGNDAVDALEAASLPAFATSLYETAEGNSTVAAFQFGKGQVIWLGWDWNNAAPSPGSQNGGWNDILLRSISTTDLIPNGVVIEGKKGDDKVKAAPSAKGFDSTDLDDVITLGKGNDKAFAGGGHDVINGDSGKDKLHGGEGDDILNGGKNKDKLWGELGGDYFLFDQGPGARHADRINDFIDGIDMILLEDSKFVGLTAGDMSNATFTAHIVYTESGWLLYDGVKFARLQLGLAISEVDFLVV
jgi:Ca2+-binding RTX toxin-like protein